MTPPFSLVIRADAAPATGVGHVMRCLALAQVASLLGMPVRMIGRVQVPWVAARLRDEGLPVTFLPGDPPLRESPADLLAQLSPAGGEVVVLDGYHFGPDCQRAARAAVTGLVVVDDYAHLPEYCCDVLLNEIIGAERLPYAGEVGEYLLGPEYALLRREFLEARALRESRSGVIPRRILLSLGGGDASAHLAALAPLLSGKNMTGNTLRVMAGAMPEGRIRDALANCPARVEVCAPGTSVPNLLLWADACITAGGSTCWELCCLGVPFLTLPIAENQNGIVAGLAEAGFAPRCDASALAGLLGGQDLEETAMRLRAFVDGQGCRRVLRRLLALVGGVTVRAALPEDGAALLALANDREVRACSLSSRPVTTEEHQQWYAERLKQGNAPFFLALCGDTLVGYVRYDKAGRGDGDFIVSTALAAPWRGLGLGARLLAETAEHLAAQGPARCTAWVKPDNIASQRVFLRAGYALEGPRVHQGETMLLFRRCFGI